jgi:tetratricopeptide (TPR) repeat protein
MKNIRFLLLNLSLASILLALATVSINAQYGNLLSKKAADALAEGNPSVCSDEMQVLIDKDANNYAAQVEQVRCFFLLYNSKKAVDGMIQNYIVIGETEAYAREAIQANIAALHTMIGKTTSANPNYAPAFNMSGLVYRMQGKNTEAEKAFARAIELDPSNFRPYANRAKMRDDLGNKAGAIADYEKVVALGINDSFIAKRLPELKGTAAKSRPTNLSQAKQAAEAVNGDLVIKTNPTFSKESMEADAKWMQNPENRRKIEELLKLQSVALAYVRLTTSQRGVDEIMNTFQKEMSGKISNSRAIEILTEAIKRVEFAIKELQTISKLKLEYAPKDLEYFREREALYQKLSGQLKNFMKSFQE